jgi:hypothetical protein
MKKLEVLFNCSKKYRKENIKISMDSIPIGMESSTGIFLITKNK